MKAIVKAMIQEGRRNAPYDAVWKEPVNNYLGDTDEEVELGTQPYSTPFVDLLECRKSVTIFDEFTDVTIQQLEHILSIYKVQQEQIQTDGYRGSHRYVPSAGARHPFELILAINHVEGIERGLWRYDAWENKLVGVKGRGDIDEVIDAIWDTTKIQLRLPLVIFVEAHFKRTLSTLPHGIGDIYLDAGILLGSLHLAATDVHAPSCILGRTGVLGVHPGFTDIGGLIVGGKEMEEEKVGF